MTAQLWVCFKQNTINRFLFQAVLQTSTSENEETAQNLIKDTLISHSPLGKVLHPQHKTTLQTKLNFYRKVIKRTNQLGS